MFNLESPVIGAYMKYLFTVPDLSCEHGRMKVDKALSTFGKAKAWAIDLDAKTIAIDSGADRAALAALLKGAGYPPDGR